MKKESFIGRKINNEKTIDGTNSNQVKFVYTVMAATVEDKIG